jgi:hypothetical protein
VAGDYGWLKSLNNKGVDMKRIMVWAGLWIFLFVTSAFAQNVRIIDIKGKVLVRQAESPGWVNADKNTPIGLGTEIRAKGNATCTVSFDNTATKVATIESKTNATVEKNGVYLSKGRVFALIKDEASDKNFEIRTPTAVAGARGTGWVTEFDGKETTVSCFDDTIQLASLDKDGRVIEEKNVVQGFEVEVRPDGTTTQPQELPEGERRVWQEFVGEVGKVIQREWQEQGFTPGTMPPAGALYPPAGTGYGNTATGAYLPPVAGQGTSAGAYYPPTGSYGNTAGSWGNTAGGYYPPTGSYGNTAGSWGNTAGGYYPPATGGYGDTAGSWGNTAGGYYPPPPGSYGDTAGGYYYPPTGGYGDTAGGYYPPPGGGYGDTSGGYYGGGWGDTAGGYYPPPPGGGYGDTSGGYYGGGGYGDTSGGYYGGGGYGDTSGGWGDTSGSWGDTSGSWGDTSGSWGDTSGSWGDTSGSWGDTSGYYYPPDPGYGNTWENLPPPDSGTTDPYFGSTAPFGSTDPGSGGTSPGSGGTSP